jgi:putative membrane protein
MVVPLALYGLIRQWVYSYRFADDGLVVRDGLLSRNVRHIPYERIHNVALVRNPLHRALGVATVRIETAAGGRPEAVMRVLAVEAAEAVRRHTLGEDREIAATVDSIATKDGPLLETPDRELVLLGLLSNRGFLDVAAVLGVLSQGDGWQGWVTNQTRAA